MFFFVYMSFSISHVLQSSERTNCNNLSASVQGMIFMYLVVAGYFFLLLKNEKLTSEASSLFRCVSASD